MLFLRFLTSTNLEPLESMAARYKIMAGTRGVETSTWGAHADKSPGEWKPAHRGCTWGFIAGKGVVKKHCVVYFKVLTRKSFNKSQ